MNVLISADMEGVCGVTSWVQVTPPEYGSGPRSSAEYERARLRMTLEVNAAAEGAFRGGADAVIVNDAHNGMRNLVPERLHPEVRFISGADKPWGMMQGIEETGDGAVFFVGYHAKAGTPAAPLAHTWTGFVTDVKLNGRSTGEFGLNSAVAGFFGAKVLLVTGDGQAVAQTQDFLRGESRGEGEAVGVVVKTGYSSTSALHLHPERAQNLIREGAEAAMRGADAVSPWVLPPKSTLEVVFDHPSRADACLYLPNVSRSGERGVTLTVTDARELTRMFRALMRAGDVNLSA